MFGVVLLWNFVSHVLQSIPQYLKSAKLNVFGKLVSHNALLMLFTSY
jgi:hypothetical protein